MKRQLSPRFLLAILAWIAPQILTAASAVSATALCSASVDAKASSASSASSASASLPASVALEDFKLSKNFSSIEGKNITLNSDMSSKPEMMMWWKSVSAYKAYSLSGDGIMRAGSLQIQGRRPAQFTIESGIEFAQTSLEVADISLIFKGEFSSGDYVSYDEKRRRNITIYEGGSIDFTKATLKSGDQVDILLVGGSMIHHHYTVTKKNTLQVSSPSTFIGKLSIGKGGILSISLDYGGKNQPSLLKIYGTLNFENNASINFSKEGFKHSLKSGDIIARAASIKANLSELKMMQTINMIDRNSGKINVHVSELKGFKLVVLKNGDVYDLMLQAVDQ